MSRKLIVLLLIVLVGIGGIFADFDWQELPEPAFSGHFPQFATLLPSMMLASAAVSDTEVPGAIRNNRYFIQSVRLANLAKLAFEEGDYAASTEYSAEAVRFAELSDEFVRLQLLIRECDMTIGAARRRLDYVISINASTRYPTEFAQAQGYHREALGYRAAENWHSAIESAQMVLATLAFMVDEPAPGTLPAQYTVRSWHQYRDSLWNIAGRPWAYNDPWQWRRLYEANRARMPEPGNPDLIHPGMVLDIPSIRGETRQGMWDPNRTYPVFGR